MRRWSMGIALVLIGLSVGTALAQQHPEVDVVQVRATDDPSVWLMDIQSADATWSVKLGDGCENLVPGPAALLVDGQRDEWLILPDATPGVCHIDSADLVTDQG